MGLTDGCCVGLIVGAALGDAVGLKVGNCVGLALGLVVGICVGLEDGLAVGAGVGTVVGEPVGLAVGALVGLAVGACANETWYDVVRHGRNTATATLRVSRTGVGLAVGDLIVLKLLESLQMYPLPAVVSARHRVKQYVVSGVSPPTVTGGSAPLSAAPTIVWTGVDEAPVGKPLQSPKS